jgi:hypothetical protein
MSASAMTWAVSCPMLPLAWVWRRQIAAQVAPPCITSWQLEFFVVDGGDEEEAQAESAAAISVTVSDNLEASGRDATRTDRVLSAIAARLTPAPLRETPQPILWRLEPW